MDWLLLAARLGLCAVFVAAGVAKLRDRSGSRQAVIDFGIPSALSGFIAGALPLTELSLALALLPARSAKVSAIALAALLAIFTGLIVSSILRGRHTVCHCFGESSSKPVGWSSVARNVALAASAVFIAWPKASAAGPGLLSTAEMTRSLGGFAAVLSVVSILVTAALAWGFIVLLRQHGRLLLRLDKLEKASAQPSSQNGSMAPAHAPPSAVGQPVGTPLPRHAVMNLDGVPVNLADELSSVVPTLLVFMDPSCGPCSTLIPELESWNDSKASRFHTAVISRGHVDANRKKFSNARLTSVFVEEATAFSEALSTLPTPSALLVSNTKRVASSVAIGSRAIRELAERATAGDSVRREEGGQHSENGAAPQDSGVGRKLPEFELPRVGGGTGNREALIGRESILIFWNPTCGFCARMLGALREWEDDPMDGKPPVSIVSTGSEEANQAMQLASPILLDESFSLGAALGVRGTPSAVLVDSEGKLASEVAVGEPAILRLLGGVKV